MKAGDRVKFARYQTAARERLTLDSVGVELKVYNLPAYPNRADVEFPSQKPIVGYSTGEYRLVDLDG